MLTILGPAKTIDTSPHGNTDTYGLPQYLDHAGEVFNGLQARSLSEEGYYFHNDLSGEHEWRFCR